MVCLLLLDGCWLCAESHPQSSFWLLLLLTGLPAWTLDTVHHSLGLSLCPVTSPQFYLLCLLPSGLHPISVGTPVLPLPLAPGSSFTPILLLLLPDNGVASSPIIHLAPGLHSS